MNEKRIARRWYLKGARDAETTETQDVSLDHTMPDFETHFELQYEPELASDGDLADVVGQSEQLPCQHDYQPDTTCGVDITCCTKCGDII